MNIYDLDNETLFQYMTKLIPDMSVFDMIENEYYKDNNNFSKNFFYYNDSFSKIEGQDKINIAKIPNTWSRCFLKVSTNLKNSSFEEKIVFNPNEDVVHYIITKDCNIYIIIFNKNNNIEKDLEINFDIAGINSETIPFYSAIGVCF